MNVERENEVGDQRSVFSRLNEARLATTAALTEHVSEDLRNFYNGLVENIDGAVGFLEGLSRSKLTRRALLLTTTAALFLTSCAPAITPTARPDGGNGDARPTDTALPPTLVPSETPVPPTATAAPTETATEVRQFPVVELKNFDKCEITPADLEDYRAWLYATQSTQFDPNTTGSIPLYEFAQKDIELDKTKSAGIDLSKYIVTGKTACLLTDATGNKSVVLPIEMFSPTTKKGEWIMAMMYYWAVTPTASGGYSVSKVKGFLDIWQKSAFPPIEDYTKNTFDNKRNTVTQQTIKDFPDLAQRINDFIRTGDPISLAQKGIYLETTVIEGQ